MTRKELENMVDELIKAAEYRQSCKEVLNSCDDFYVQNLDALTLADRELLELTELLISRLVKAGHVSE